MAVTIEPLGGLGNQLFIYGLGLRLARELQTDLICDTWNFHNYSWHVYELDTFDNSISQTLSSKWREKFGHKARGITRRIRPLHFVPKLFSKLVLETDSLFDESVLQISDGTRLSGYFQSWRYFEPVAHEIKHQVMTPRNPSPWLYETRATLALLGDWVAVHVRRGTYLEVPVMGIVGGEYYRRAINLMDRLVGALPLVVFSDSPELLPQLMGRYGERVTFVDSPAHVRAIDVLQVMSDASHLIIGNSTFSWWAGYLRQDPNRIVMAPRPWLDISSFNERDLLLPEWISVGRYGT